MNILKSKSAQSTLEYAIIIAVVVAGLLAIQIYMRRGIQGKLRESTDKIGSQYVPGKMNSTYTTQQTGDMVTTETFGVGGQGISKYSVDTPAPVTHSATGADAETSTSGLSDETTLYP